jgi:hypothetical protein
MEALILSLNGWLELQQHEVNYRILTEIENDIFKRIVGKLSETDLKDFEDTFFQIQVEQDFAERKRLWSFNLQIIEKYL